MQVAKASYDAYLFDLDGTLIDTAPDLNVALNRTLQHHGHSPVDESLTRHWVGHGARVLIERALAHQQTHDDAELDDLFDTFIGYYENHIADLSTPYPGVISTLSLLKERGARLAVVTNKITRLTDRLLTDIDLDHWFDTVVCGDSTPRPKPAADPVLHACETLDVAVTRTLLVGDSSTDVESARSAGCPVVCVSYGYSHGIPAAELGADAVIESFTELV